MDGFPSKTKIIQDQRESYWLKFFGNFSSNNEIKNDNIFFLNNLCLLNKIKQIIIHLIIYFPSTLIIIRFIFLAQHPRIVLQCFLLIQAYRSRALFMKILNPDEMAFLPEQK